MVPIGPLLNSQVGLAQHRPVTPDEPGGLGHPVAGEHRAADHNGVVAAQVVDGLHRPGVRLLAWRLQAFGDPFGDAFG